jgi:Putative DNA-binding domain
VNEIANRAFLTGDSNVSLSNTEPSKYLPEIEKKYPGALAKQFVPQDPALWNLDRFEDFLVARRKLIADAINERMAELLADLEAPKAQTLEEMVAGGESPVLEFKSSLRWDLRAQQINTDLQKVVAKTVAGLMNFEGGTLLIGVADDGTVIGIENDLKTLKRGDLDRFEQTLRQALADYLGVIAHDIVCTFRVQV